MARTNIPIEEEPDYEFSECVTSEIEFYYPDSLHFRDPSFNRKMTELQLAMLRCHHNIMSPSDRRRALDTVRQLKAKLGDPHYG